MLKLPKKHYKSEIIIIGPSNPITSIEPIINLNQIKRKLLKNRNRVIAISPIIGQAPISGPTALLMKAKNLEVTPLEIAKMYQDFCSTIIIDKTDYEFVEIIESETSMKVQLADILFKDITKAKNLATMILNQVTSDED